LAERVEKKKKRWYLLIEALFLENEAIRPRKRQIPGNRVAPVNFESRATGPNGLLAKPCALGIKDAKDRQATGQK